MSRIGSRFDEFLVEQDLKDDVDRRTVVKLRTPNLFGRNSMQPCRCEEANMAGSSRRLIGGQALPLQPGVGWQRMHDCRYITERNRLIPEAERQATLAVVHMTAGRSKDLEWTRQFLGAMDQLWRVRNAS